MVVVLLLQVLLVVVQVVLPRVVLLILLQLLLRRRPPPLRRLRCRTRLHRGRNCSSCVGDGAAADVAADENADATAAAAANAHADTYDAGAPAGGGIRYERCCRWWFEQLLDVLVVHPKGVPLRVGHVHGLREVLGELHLLHVLPVPTNIRVPIRE